MAFFGLKLGLDLEMRAAHPRQKFQGVPPPGFTATLQAESLRHYLQRFHPQLTVLSHA